MPIPIIDNFKVYTSKPIDTRLVVADNTERDALNVSYRYDGMLTYVSSSNKFYLLQDGTSNSDWTELRVVPTGSFSGSFTGSFSGITTSSIANWGTEVSRSAAFYGFGATSGSGGGEANTAGNLGGGQGIFESKDGINLQFRSLSTGSAQMSMSISTDNQILIHLISVDGGTF